MHRYILLSLYVLFSYSVFAQHTKPVSTKTLQTSASGQSVISIDTILARKGIALFKEFNLWNDLPDCITAEALNSGVTPSAPIPVRVYDKKVAGKNGINIYYNDQLVYNKSGLPNEPVYIKLKPDKEQPSHQVVIVSDNIRNIIKAGIKFNVITDIWHQQFQLVAPDCLCGEDEDIDLQNTRVAFREGLLPAIKTKLKVFDLKGISPIIVDDTNAAIKLYDAGKIDGDSISVYFNGDTIVYKQETFEIPITIPLKINKPLNELVMIADNLGSTPPNTAVMELIIGERSYSFSINTTSETGEDNRYEQEKHARTVANTKYGGIKVNLIKDCNTLKEYILYGDKQTATKTITQTSIKPVPKIQQKDSALINPGISVTKAVTPTRSLQPVPAALIQRENVLAKTIIAHSKEIKIMLYDNGEIDNDTITVYHNNKVVALKQRLSHTPITITLTADENDPVHELVMYADNLGDIPPNTALMIVYADGKRYEVHLTSTEQKNAKVIIRYEKD